MEIDTNRNEFYFGVVAVANAGRELCMCHTFIDVAFMNASPVKWVFIGFGLLYSFGNSIISGCLASYEFTLAAFSRILKINGFIMFLVYFIFIFL